MSNPKKADDAQDVMDVEKTVSPKRLFSAPKERPLNDCPLLRCKTAGMLDPAKGVWVAKFRASRLVGEATDLTLRIANMVAEEG